MKRARTDIIYDEYLKIDEKNGNWDPNFHISPSIHNRRTHVYYKQFFDCGFALKAGDKHADKGVYAPNVWPDDTHFRDVVLAYYKDALQVSKDVLDAVIRAVDANAEHFEGAFDEPMAVSYTHLTLPTIYSL